MVEFSQDPHLSKLPHPLRAQTCLAPFLTAIEKSIGTREWQVVCNAFRSPDFLLANLPQLIDENQLRRFGSFFETAAHAPGGTELGGAMASLVGIRHLVSPYRLFRVEDKLVELLGMTDMDADIPVSFLKLPFRRCFVELGQRRDIDAVVPNDVSGLHVLEGAYLEEGRHPARGNGIYVLMSGSPMGKEHCMDDATHAVFLSTENPDLPLTQALDNAFYIAQEQSSQGGYNVPERATFDQAVRNLQWLIKALLYIGLPEARTSLHAERAELEEQLKHSKSSSKRAKLLRRIGRVCDTVVVHAPALPSAPSLTVAEEHALRAAHWRRGHYRRQAHGPMMQLRKLIFVAPMYVSGADNATETKTYIVR